MKTMRRWINSDFTFGFEFEAISNNTKRQREIIENFFHPRDINIGDDGSIDYMDSDDDYGYEWRSPVMKFTPSNIQKSIKILQKLQTEGCSYVNRTCGFHVHIGFPDKDKLAEQMFWVILNLAFSTEMLMKILKFKDFEFFQYKYASYDFLNNLRDKVLSDISNNKFDVWNILKHFYSTEKYRNLRIHPQGTLEWRGPRGFMEGGINDITPFFIKCLVPFVSWIGETLSKDSIEISGITIKKKDVFNALSRGKIIHTQRKTKVSNYIYRNEIKEIIKEYPYVKDYFKKAKSIGIITGITKTNERFPILYNMNIDGAKISNSIIYNGSYTNCEFKDCLFFTHNSSLMKISGITRSSFNSIANGSVHLYNCIITNCVGHENVNLYVSKCSFNKTSVRRIDGSDLFINNCEIRDIDVNRSTIINSRIYYGQIRNSVLKDCKTYNANIIDTSEVYSSEISDCSINNSKIFNSTFTDKPNNVEDCYLYNCIGKIHTLKRSLIAECKLQVVDSVHSGENKEVFRGNCKSFHNIIKDGKDLFIKRIIAGYKLDFINDSYNINNKEKCMCQGENKQCEFCFGVGFYNRAIVSRDSNYPGNILERLVLNNQLIQPPVESFHHRRINSFEEIVQQQPSDLRENRVSWALRSEGHEDPECCSDDDYEEIEDSVFDRPTVMNKQCIQDDNNTIKNLIHLSREQLVEIVGEQQYNYYDSFFEELLLF